MQPTTSEPGVKNRRRSFFASKPCSWSSAAPAIAAIVWLGFIAAASSRAADAGPSDEEALTILQAICPGKVRSHTLKNGKSYGCGGCPALTSFSGQPPSSGTEPDFELRKVLKGSFTRPGASEQLVEFFGCEPHADNFGGTMLLEKSGSKLRRVRYFQGVVGIVRSYPLKSGREIVLSQGGYTGQGISTGWVSTYDFSAKPDPAEHTLLRVEDTSGNSCESERIRIAYIPKLEFPDLNGDGIPDLRVTVRWGQADVPARYRGKCKEAFEPPEVPAYLIDFLFDGKTFHVAPTSASTLRRVSSASQ
jgi:hypothetical protein